MKELLDLPNTAFTLPAVNEGVDHPVGQLGVFKEGFGFDGELLLTLGAILVTSPESYF